MRTQDLFSAALAPAKFAAFQQVYPSIRQSMRFKTSIY